MSKKRRRAERKQTEFASGLNKITEDARGVLMTSIVTRDNHHNVVMAELLGDPQACAVMDGLRHWMETREKFGSRENHDCLLCGHEITNNIHPAAYAVAGAFSGEGVMMISGICPPCVAKTDDLYAAACSHWRKFWLGLYTVETGTA